MSLSITRRVFYIAPALALMLAQLPLVAQQSPAQVNGAGAGSASWADEVLKTEGYMSPPKELADAVLIPRYLNVSLSSPSPDKKWFVHDRESTSHRPLAHRTTGAPSISSRSSTAHLRSRVHSRPTLHPFELLNF